MRVTRRVGAVILGAAVFPLTALALHFSASAAPPSPQTASKAYQVDYLISDGTPPAENHDPDLRNAWGIAASPTGPWWVALNEAQASKLYDGDGAPQDLRVTVPGPPTGIVYSGGSGFVVTDGAVSGPARVLFAAENGTISGWSPDVGPAAPMGQAFTAVDSSVSGAIYTGLAIASTSEGDRLYAADFHNARIDVFDETFSSITPTGGFVDPRLPAGYAPFGIQTLSGRVFVAYALQDPNAMDEVSGQGLGVVDVFDTDGNLIARVGAHGRLNAPWGLAIAPSGFGDMSGNLLVGNFGDGTIAAYAMTDDMEKFTPNNVLRDADNKPIRIDGLWGIAFGNGATSGPTNALYFAAGPAEETHGIFGRITLAPTPTP